MKKAYCLVIIFYFFFGCGKGGSSGAANDAAPSGTVVAQGSFTGLNGKSVTGVAVIYRLTNSDTYVVRVEGISTPNEAGLEIIADTSQERVLRTYLRATLGTQNYQSTASGVPTWTSVTIYSTQTSFEYGKALLQQTWMK